MSERIDRQPSVSPADYWEYLVGVAERVGPRPVESLPLSQCLGRYLAADAFSQVDIPGFANAAMDGYAVRAVDLAETPASLLVVGEQPAGRTRNITVQAGEAVRIMTGAPLPSGADTVVNSELTAEQDGTVVIDRSLERGANVRLEGEDSRAGSLVLSRGVRLAAQHLSAAAASGHKELPVTCRVQVAVISTGDELAAPGSALEPGMIYDSNSYLLEGLARQLGADVHRLQMVADTEAALRSVLDQAATSSDLLLLSGGVSVGRYDVVRNLLDGTPQSWFTRVAIQPGKPQGIASWNGVPVLAFPGNPVGVFVSFQLFGAPFLTVLSGGQPGLSGGEPGLSGGQPGLSGGEPGSGRLVRVQAGASWKCPVERQQFTPVSLATSPDGILIAYPVNQRGSGSHLVTSLARIEALAVADEETQFVREGDTLNAMIIQ